MKSPAVPDGIPVLSRGKHRSPRRGACFMELASVMAGEQWSDHPSCTHPLLGHLARLVNDHTSDGDRHLLAPLIPSVVGRRGDDTAWVSIAVAVSTSTILDVPEGTQRVLAAGILKAEEMCGNAGPDAAPELVECGRDARAALDLVPGAVAWVQRLGISDPVTPKAFAAHCAPTMVRRAVEGVVAGGGADTDARLRTLLEVGIAACPAPAEVVERPPTASSPEVRTRAGG
jgi:hypothetical protein